MTGKERILAALRHEEPDRVPLDVGGTNNTAMHLLVEKEIKKRLGLNDNGGVTRIQSQQLALPDQEFMDHFQTDACAIYLNEQQPWQYHEDEDYYTDAWGIGYKINPDGYYYNFHKNPLSAAETVDEIMEFEPPMPTEYMLQGLRERIDANRDRCLVLEGLRSPMFGLPSWLRGEENFYMDLLSDDGMLDCLLHKVTESYIKILDFVFDRIGTDLDIVKFADDLGTQTSLLLSPETYREKIKPRHAKLFAHARARTGCSILLHSCGAIRPLINDFIEIGVDALNPVQISAADMEPASLKAEFGDRITFWGGCIDTQHTLSFGSPDDVREEVRRNLEAFKPGGGYVFAQVHNVMPGVPMDNLLAMYEAHRLYGNY